MADRATGKAASAHDWKLSAELAQVTAHHRHGLASQQGPRLSLKFHYDRIVAPGWRAVFSDDLDLGLQYAVAKGRHGSLSHTAVNTLKEAYLSRQWQSDYMLDVGRINIRYGVALGYNPTDYFRFNAIRTISSLDPENLRRNRLGSVVLRGQKLWSGGSVTGLCSPRLASRPSPAAFSADLGASNGQTRCLLAINTRLATDFEPQFLLSQSEGKSPQFGLNLTWLLNDATVMFAEWSGGRNSRLLDDAFAQANGTAFRSQLAAGLTYTSARNLTLTLEYDYNGRAADRSAWKALRAAPLPVLGAYLSHSQAAYEQASRQAIFAHLLWKDALVSQLDIAAMTRLNPYDHSRNDWISAVYHGKQFDLGLQWQRNGGRGNSQYGLVPQRTIWQVAGIYHF
ncbi:hypothetical protein [Chitinimonas lacunae]|uniref:Porin n=1 Tax=Chitinimonas lacunae TaxID=1963018 RepID=A0ABV8MP34_9NEIS